MCDMNQKLKIKYHKNGANVIYMHHKKRDCYSANN